MDIIKQLDKLGKNVLNSVPYINKGGCAVFATMVAKSLNSKGIPASLFSCYDTEWGAVYIGGVDEARGNVSDIGDLYEWNSNGVWLNHVGVEFELDGKLYFYDTHGVTKPASSFIHPEWIVQDGRFTVEEMEALAERPHNWNQTFKRKYIPQIQQLVEEHLNV